MNDDEGLPPDIQSFFDAERARPPLAPEEVRALREATDAQLPPRAPPVPRVSGRLSAALTGAALGAVVGAAGVLALRPARVERVVETRVVVREVPAAPTVPVAATPFDAGGGANAQHADAAASLENGARPRGASNGDALSREQLLLQRARSATLRGDGDAALEALSMHARQFPTGALVEEREALRVSALVVARREAEARARAADFHRRWPSSLLGDMVDRAIEGAAGRRE